MEDEPAPYSPQLRAVLQDLDREVRQFDLRLLEAGLTDDVRGLCDRLYDLEAESAAQRAEISRLHGRVPRLEDQVHQGRGWLLHLPDRTTALEEATQKLAIKVRSLVTLLRETLSETVATLRILILRSLPQRPWMLLNQMQKLRSSLVPPAELYPGSLYRKEIRWATAGDNPQLLGSALAPISPRLHSPALRAAADGVLTSKDNHKACDERNKVLFDQLCRSHGAYSEVLQQLASSREGAVIQSRLLSKVSDTTAARYLRSVQLFFCAFEELGGNMDAIDQSLFLDAFFALSRGSESGPLSNSINVLKALRWYKKLLAISCLPDLYGTAFSLLSSPANLADRIWAGSFLVAIGASLRFADAQHVRWSTLCISNFTLRGICYRTKTTKGGCPWGLLSFGAFSSAEAWGMTWLPHWLGALDTVWADIRSRFGPQPEPDCLFFLWIESGFAPASYSQALQKLRYMLTLSGIAPAAQYTLHSLKTTFLSWMSQLSIPLASRFQQGHHKAPGSAQLYSRDDVWPALRAQWLLWRSIHAGFRPARPQHRVGQSPLVEPLVETSGFQWEEYCLDLSCFVLGNGCQSFLALEHQDSDLREARESSSVITSLGGQASLLCARPAAGGPL
ncbi:unnamed protein product [Symbiodinium sp. CCMP2592]|nr:unnamed protein product [Symbiodinium sp. CCMP2592]